jgi:hypothetical protein
MYLRKYSVDGMVLGRAGIGWDGSMGRGDYGPAGAHWVRVPVFFKKKEV